MSGRGRGGGRGEDYGHGNGRDIDYGEKSSYADTNGHTGGGGDAYQPNGSDWQHLPVDNGDHPDAPKGSSEEEHHDNMSDSGASGSNTGIGRMQRVGDKWVFVRTEASEVA